MPVAVLCAAGQANFIGASHEGDKPSIGVTAPTLFSSAKNAWRYGAIEGNIIAFVRM